MDFELESISAAGERFVELADKHAVELGRTSDRHDRERTVPEEGWAELRRSGFLAGTVPAELGGLGVSSVVDLVAGLSRLARGDASVAIGATMHLSAMRYLALLRGDPATRADPDLGRGIGLLLRACARGRLVACVAISERGTSLGWPATVAEPAEGGGYRVSGTKSFCTNSPVATVFLTSVRVLGDPDGPRLGFALVPRGTAGLTVLDDWDGMGMRASGSGDVVLAGCPVPARTVLAAGPLGRLSAALLPLTTVGAVALAACFLGIAEQAQTLAVSTAGRRRRRPGGPPLAELPPVQAIVAENEVDLATSRGVLARTAALLDERLEAAGAAGDEDRLEALMAAAQCAAVAAKRSAIAVVDRALTASGGGGYVDSNPMSRLYRDVRAGPFMQPFSALEAFTYIGRVTLGLDTDPEG